MRSLIRQLHNNNPCDLRPRPLNLHGQQLMVRTFGVQDYYSVLGKHRWRISKVFDAILVCHCHRRRRFLHPRPPSSFRWSRRVQQAHQSQSDMCENTVKSLALRRRLPNLIQGYVVEFLVAIPLFSIFSERLIADTI